jgi:hypothetical protein
LIKENAAFKKDHVSFLKKSEALKEMLLIADIFPILSININI